HALTPALHDALPISCQDQRRLRARSLSGRRGSGRTGRTVNRRIAFTFHLGAVVKDAVCVSASLPTVPAREAAALEAGRPGWCRTSGQTIHRMADMADFARVGVLAGVRSTGAAAGRARRP